LRPSSCFSGASFRVRKSPDPLPETFALNAQAHSDAAAIFPAVSTPHFYNFAKREIVQ
jgi:hypothetical protein